MNFARVSRGFTLIEALASLVLLSVGVVGTMSALSAISANQARLGERELMQQLAQDKYDEVLATGETAGSGQSGDFSDRGLPEISWSTDIQATGTENLESLTVTVQGSNNTDDQPGAKIVGLFYRAPENTDPAATGGTN